MTRELCIITAFSLLTLLTALPFFAGENVWTTEGPWGRVVVTIAIDPLETDTLYVSTELGVFKSEDGAKSWLPAGSNQPMTDTLAPILIDPVCTSTIYGLEYSGALFKSTDGGLTWQAANDGLPVGPEQNILKVVADPVNPGTVYAVRDFYGHNGEIYKSLDGGAEWFPARDGITAPFLHELAMDPLEPGTLYAGGEWDFSYDWPCGFFKTTDGGAAWEASDDDLPEYYYYIYTLAPDPMNRNTLFATINSDEASSGLYRSTDGADSWTHLNGPGYRSWARIDAIGFDPQTPGSMYAAWWALWDPARQCITSSVSRSVDGGVTWTVLNNGLPPCTLVYDIAVGRSDPSALYA